MSYVLFSTSNWKFKRQKMKLALAAIALLAVASPSSAYQVPAAGSGALASEAQEFVDLVPLDDVIQIIRAYIAEDEQIQALLELASSDVSAQFIKEVEAIRQFKKLANYVQKAGLDIYLLLNKLNKSVRLNPISPLGPISPLSAYPKITGGAQGLVEDLTAVVPINQLKQLLAEKQKSSAVIRDLVKQVQSPQNMLLVLRILGNPNLAKLMEDAHQAGVPKDSFGIAYPVILAAHVVRSN
ncbi:protein G12-like [Halictus rubicundus]|uniref:protein G12-like n=1 Tax=Halictus rubicundus TaxID=77578 RepID=UPI004036651D